jgi:hypothetical protein
VNNLGDHDEDEYSPFEDLDVSKWDDEDDLLDPINENANSSDPSGSMYATMDNAQLTSGLMSYNATPSPPISSRPNTTGSTSSALKSNLKSPNAEKRAKGTVSFSSVGSTSENKQAKVNTTNSFNRGVSSSSSSNNNGVTPGLNARETEKLAKHLESSWTGDGAIRVVSINGQMLEAKKDVVKVETERMKAPSPPSTSPSSKGSFRSQASSSSSKKVHGVTVTESKQSYPIHHDFNTAANESSEISPLRPGSLRDEDYVEREKELGNGMVNSYYPDVTMAVQDLMNRYNNRVTAN